MMEPVVVAPKFWSFSLQFIMVDIGANGHVSDGRVLFCTIF
jgi:hypothetical protein